MMVWESIEMSGEFLFIQKILWKKKKIKAIESNLQLF